MILEKNLVKIMMETAGFEMHDLGRDVPAEEFVNQAEALKAQLCAFLFLMTTTMSGMEDIIELLKEEGIRDNVEEKSWSGSRYRRNMQMISGGWLFC